MTNERRNVKVKKKKAVQGSYISKECKDALRREALRQDKFPSAFTAELLEREARKIIRQEERDGYYKPGQG